MRLGLLGPSNGDLAGLARAAEFLLNVVRVTRAIYLGADDALEETVGLWAESLVGKDPSDEGVWERAFEVAATGNTEQLDTFLRNERARLRLKALERLPLQELRAVEMFGDRVAVLIHDKAHLDEEDIFSATFLVYGKSDSPLVKKIGPRWFVTPGPLGDVPGGVMVLDDSGDEVVATLYDDSGQVLRSEALPAGRAAKLSVQG
ncbi:MAG TPA: hypothetical protein VF765_24890 [Polyangiaceae bacterium]